MNEQMTPISETSAATSSMSSPCRCTVIPLEYSSAHKNTANKRMRRQSVGSMEDKLAKKATIAAKKIKRAEEKTAMLAAVEANKIYKPGVCMQYMNIVMHPSLLGAWYMAGVEAEAQAAGCRLRPAADPMWDPALVMWTRNVQPTLDGGDGQMALTAMQESCACASALYVLEACAVAEYVRARTLAKHLCRVRCKHYARRLTLVVYGAKDYFKKPKRKSDNNNRKIMTSVELEMAITDLLVSTTCDALLVDTPADLALLVINYTQAVARAPERLARRMVDDQAGFYMRGDNKNTVALDSDGNGVTRLWQQMVATLPHTSLETARALCAQYKSPLLLHEALTSPDGISRVASVDVSRSATATASSRRLGPELARKLHVLFTAEDGDCLLE